MINPPVYDLRNPFPWYAHMRKHQPIWQEQASTWHVFRHDDVLRVLSDYEHFSSQRGEANDPNRPISSSLISMDPPRHRQLRTLVSQAFTPRAIANLTARIEEISNSLLDDFQGQTHLDIVESLTYPLPVIVIAELLGVPSDERDRFKMWSDAVIAGSRQLASGEVLSFEDAQMEMVQYFSQLVAERKKTPKADLISDLLRVKVDGESLSMAEILGFCVLLLVAGNETTTNLLSNALYTLHEIPSLWPYLAEQPDERLAAFVEEVLRFRAPIQHMYRTTTCDVELSGVPVPAGSRMVAWIGSANRDEAVYEQPETFQVNRKSRHLAFGHGIHFCLGAPLARLEAELALKQLLRRYTSIAIPDVDASEPVPTSLVYGFHKMEVQLTPLP
ncbi:cytochrome P450 [Alicyclobacillus fodiniaquatilis]|uniref:Cytochrome P450 n=1 Tax=Alicyclobacillus fodiniaquatilis TaxID=1661150 RepID=A0ABW4JJB5_9BACL